MDQKAIQQLFDKNSGLLVQTAQVLGKTSAHVYEVIIRQQFIDSMIGILQWGLFFIISFFAYRYIWKLILRKYNKDEEPMWFLLGAALTLIVFIVSLLFCSDVGEIVGKLINPEYYAVKFILDSVTK